MRLEDWGLIEYESAVAKQFLYVEEVSAGAEECIVMCTHPPVVTLGRGSQPEDIVGWKGSVVESSRGGRATYHGPSQIVIGNPQADRAGLQGVHGGGHKFASG